jgi:hypothetical protein
MVVHSRPRVAEMNIGRLVSAFVAVITGVCGVACDDTGTDDSATAAGGSDTGGGGSTGSGGNPMAGSTGGGQGGTANSTGTGGGQSTSGGGTGGNDSGACSDYEDEANRIADEIATQWAIDSGGNTGREPCEDVINDWYLEQCEALLAAAARVDECLQEALTCTLGTNGCACRWGGVCDDGSCVAGQCARVPYRGASYFAVDGCGLSTGIAMPEGEAPTTSTSQGPRVESSDEEADVRCQVSSQGDGFSITGVIEQGTGAFMVDGIVAPAGNGYSGLGTIAQLDGATSLNLSSALDACELTVLPNQDIAEGRVWGNFDCAEVSNRTDPGCPAQGSFVFENCDREPSCTCSCVCRECTGTQSAGGDMCIGDCPNCAATCRDFCLGLGCGAVDRYFGCMS